MRKIVGRIGVARGTGMVRRRWCTVVSGLVFAGILCSWAASARAQELPRVVINEVLADNGGVEPIDIGGGTPDLIEIFNASDQVVTLGTSSAPTSWYLSDSVSEEFDALSSWRFPAGAKSEIPPGGHLVIFADGNLVEALCELHAGFSIASDGTEPITLWGPEGQDGKRPIVDRIWLPPLRSNVSFGRSPDGMGPAPVPVEETFDHLVYFPAGSESPPTFGMCEAHPTQTDLCKRIAPGDRLCAGAENGSGASAQEPRIERARFSTNHPAADEAVAITARVRDDELPTPGNIAKAQIIYRVDGGERQTVELEYDVATGVLDGSDAVPPVPADRWTLWRGTIPAQPAGARVEFHLRVEDEGALASTSPRDLCGEPDGPCPECTGPCDREFGGPDCMRDQTDVTCEGSGSGDGEGDGGALGTGAVIGERYIACDAWFTYVAGYEPRAELQGLVINEVVPDQDGLLLDSTQRKDCQTSTNCPVGDDNCCPPDDPQCCKKREDFIELYNSSDAEISLAGLWLSDSPFHPREWQFPAGAKIGAGEYLIIWTDNDGGKCPDPFRVDPPCFWECPDPTDPSRGEYHTNFALGRAEDEIYLYDDEANGYGVVHSVEWGDGSLTVQLNESIALLPDGDRSGCFRVISEPTPRAANVGSCMGEEPMFLRGDANNDCGVDLTDAVFTLNWLFQGGTTPACFDAADTDDSGGIDLTDPIALLNYLFTGGIAPRAPGPDNLGPDPTPDEFAECQYNSSCTP